MGKSWLVDGKLCKVGSQIGKKNAMGEEVLLLSLTFQPWNYENVWAWNMHSSRLITVLRRELWVPTFVILEGEVWIGRKFCWQSEGKASVGKVVPVRSPDGLNDLQRHSAAPKDWNNPQTHFHENAMPETVSRLSLLCLIQQYPHAPFASLCSD